MKGRKKLAGFMAVVLAAILILPVTTVAKAAVTSTNSITINGVNTGTAHTFVEKLGESTWQRIKSGFGF